MKQPRSLLKLLSPYRVRTNVYLPGLLRGTEHTSQRAPSGVDSLIQHMLENTDLNRHSSYPLYRYDTGVVQRALLPMNTSEDQEERTCQILFIHLTSEKRLKRIPGSREPTPSNPELQETLSSAEKTDKRKVPHRLSQWGHPWPTHVTARLSGI